MTARMLFVLALVCAVQLGLSSSSSAQTSPVQPSNCFLYLTAHDLGIDMGSPVPFGAFLVWQNNLPGEGGESIYGFAKSTCSPPAGAGEGCPGCAGLAAGKPINLATGNTYIEQNDLRIPGLGGGLALMRTWNSAWPASLATFEIGIFGANWRSTYEERIVMGLDNYPKYLRGDGSAWSFGLGSGWTVVAPANVVASLNTDTSQHPYYVLTFQNGEQRRFDKTTGNLIAIIDRNGNTTTIAYDSSGRLSTVTDAASRQLTFSYGTSGNLVSTVTSSVGITLAYVYDQQGRISQITKPDASTLNFTYDSQSRITAVKDSNLKVLESHTYDAQSRGLTSSRANGVEAVTVSYPNP
jgi:YD repeat-containing protein